MNEGIAEKIQSQIVDEVRAFLQENWGTFMADFEAEYIAHGESDKPFKKPIGMTAVITPEGREAVKIEFTGKWAKSVKVKHEPVEITTACRTVEPIESVE